MHIPEKNTLGKIKTLTEKAPNVSSHLKAYPYKHREWILIKPICRCFILTNHSYSKEMLSTLQTFHYSWPPGNSEAASSWKNLPNNSKKNNSAAGKAQLMAEGGLSTVDIQSSAARALLVHTFMRAMENSFIQKKNGKWTQSFALKDLKDDF